VRHRGPGPEAGRVLPGLLLALWGGQVWGCAPLFHAAPPPAPNAEAAAPPAPRAPAGPEGVRETGAVERALALADAGRPQAGLILLKGALQAGTAPEEDALYWIGMLSLAPPVSDRAGGREALAALVKRHPDGARGRAAAALLALLEEVDRLEAENASLHQDMKQLLDIDVEAQKKRRGGTGAAPP
jgi:hypothetical protein